MVSLPVEFVATKLPGYFWNTKTKRLFTAKLGVLRELVMTNGRWHWSGEDGYRVSDKGRRRYLPLSYLHALPPNVNSVFPVEFLTVKSSTNDDVAVNLGNLPAGTRVRVIIEG